VLFYRLFYDKSVVSFQFAFFNHPSICLTAYALLQAFYRRHQMAPTFFGCFDPLCHYILQLAGPQWWPNHCASTFGFQLGSSLLLHSQHDARSAVSHSFLTAVCRCLPTTPKSFSILPIDCAGEPLHPSSTGNSQVLHPLCLQVLASFAYLLLFLSYASSHPSSQRTVSSMMIMFLV